MAKPTQRGDQWDVPLFLHGVWAKGHGYGAAAREVFWCWVWKRLLEGRTLLPISLWDDGNG